MHSSNVIPMHSGNVNLCVTDIEWDDDNEADNDDCDLPTEMNITMPAAHYYGDDESVAEVLSSETGFCVNSYNVSVA